MFNNQLNETFRTDDSPPIGNQTFRPDSRAANLMEILAVL